MLKRFWIPTAAIMVAALAFSIVVPGAAVAAPAEQGASNPDGVDVPPGYFLEAAVTGLDFPTAITFGPDSIYVSEAGVPPSAGPLIKRVSLDGSTEVVLSASDLAAGMLVPPLVDVTYHDGWIWAAHRQIGVNGWAVGAISRFDPADPSGTFETVLTNLPSAGDHSTDEIAFDASGRAYFSQGTATNSSVVGPDNFFITGWLDSFPDFHDFPAVDVALSGTDYTSPNPLTADPNDEAVTAPFHAFGSGPVAAGTVVPAASPSSPQEGIVAGVGAVYSFDPSDPLGTLALEGWGLRNPFGIALDPFQDGILFVSNNGADVRQGPAPEGGLQLLGSRPITNEHDDVFRVDLGGDAEFYGWPDYFHNPTTGAVMPVTDPLFCSDADVPIPCPDFVFSETFRNGLSPQAAFAQLENHSAAGKLDISTSDKFKYVGDLFVTETGSFIPVTGANEFTGYKVVRVDRETGEVTDFIVNEGDTAEELFDPAGFNKPIDVKFHGDLMFIVDFGIYEPGLGRFETGTGKIWIASHGNSGIVRATK